MKQLIKYFIAPVLGCVLAGCTCYSTHVPGRVVNHGKNPNGIDVFFCNLDYILFPPEQVHVVPPPAPPPKVHHHHPHRPAPPPKPAPRPVVIHHAPAPAPAPVVVVNNRPAPRPVVIHHAPAPAPAPVVVVKNKPAPRPVVVVKNKPAPRPAVANKPQRPSSNTVVTGISRQQNSSVKRPSDYKNAAVNTAKPQANAVYTAPKMNSARRTDNNAKAYRPESVKRQPDPNASPVRAK